jgi:hypothetical protein
VLAVGLAVVLNACGTATVPTSALTPTPVAATDAPAPTLVVTNPPSPAPTTIPTAKATASALDAIEHCAGAASTGSGRSVARGSTWSGYVAAQPPAAFSCVEAAWVEPVVTCGAADAAVAIWVGIGGYTSRDLGIFDDEHALEKAGTGVDCEDGAATHYAWHQIEPGEASDQPFGALAGQPADMAIAAGDRMWAQVRFADGAYRMTVANRTTGDVRSISQASAGKRRSSANWVVEGETGAWLARFPSITFTGGASTMGGVLGTIGSTAWLRNEVDEWSGGFRRLRVSALSPDGTSFHVTWLHR